MSSVGEKAAGIEAGPWGRYILRTELVLCRELQMYMSVQINIGDIKEICLLKVENSAGSTLGLRTACVLSLALGAYFIFLESL